MGSTDAFLGGRLNIAQSPSYRAGADPVLLAAAVPAREGESVLELGCGAGVALLCLGARVPGLSLTGVERDAALAGLAARNATANRIDAEIVTADLSALPPALRARQFDHVMMNPPFFADGSSSGDKTRAGSRHEKTPLGAWLDAGIRRLKPEGCLTVIQRTGRLPEVFAALDARLGGMTLRPLAPRAGREAKLAILTGRKGRRAPFRLLPPFILHEGDSHLSDGDDYAPGAVAILRDGEGFPD